MLDKSQLPHLIKLLDDDSPVVQKAIIKDLQAYGENLQSELATLEEPLTPQQWQKIRNLLFEQSKSRLMADFTQWKDLPESVEQLERGMEILAQYQMGFDDRYQLGPLLDQLASEYSRLHFEVDTKTLAFFLFEEIGLAGAQDDYYNPANSNLIQVIETKKGLPISLTLVYILVGHRLGLEIFGCNFPGHFLARTTFQKNSVWVDCFNKGQFLTLHDFFESRNQKPNMKLQQILWTAATPFMVLRRVVKNLVLAHERNLQTNDQKMMEELYKKIFKK